VWVVVGLGNPGRRYVGTRHNLGFMVVDACAERAGVRFAAHDRYDAARADWAGALVVLAKPRTYVNRSGEAVGSVLAQNESAQPRLLVVVDDIHLPFGRLRLRPAGGAGGHNGLRSIEAALGSSAYARLRVGVGAPEGAAPWADHVLGDFDAMETAALPGVVTAAADAVERILSEGLEQARAQINAPPPDAD
jgi:PTH1 family peptidyl-tRNA hydrolase